MMTAAVSVLIVVVSILALIWTLQRRLIYFPTADVPTTDAIGRMDVEPVTFETIDGLRLERFVLVRRRGSWYSCGQEVRWPTPAICVNAWRARGTPA